MCDQCSRNSPNQPTGKPSLSRRALLAMGVSTATGVVLGLWNCQNPPPGTRPLASTLFNNTTVSSFTLVLTTSGPASSQSASTAASAQASQSTAATQTSSSTSTPSAPATQSTSASQAADLGSEVFPDSSGKAIARPSDAPVIIIPRTGWTAARPDLAHIEPMNGISRITVHHTAGAIQTDAWKPTAGELEGIREFHAGTRPADRHWADIAYHFAIDRAGRVWQARPLAYQGAHARGHNPHNMGIVLLGDFSVQTPSAAQLTSLALFIGFTRKLYGISLDNVFTHGELVNTDCPGPQLQDYMDRGRKSWGEAEGLRWTQATTFPASDPALPVQTPSTR